MYFELKLMGGQHYLMEFLGKEYIYHNMFKKTCHISSNSAIHSKKCSFKRLIDFIVQD